MSLTVGYTPDAPSVVQQTFTATTNLSDASGNVVATSAAPFIVNQPQPGGDKASTTDDGNHEWAEASDSGSVAVFQAQL